MAFLKKNRLLRIIVAINTVIAIALLQAQFSTAKPDIKEYTLASHILGSKAKGNGL